MIITLLTGQNPTVKLKECHGYYLIINLEKFMKIKRLCMLPLEDDKPKMHILFECHGKVGTTASTILWFLSEPRKGEWAWGIDENTHYSPYMKGHAFRYAKFCLYMIDDVYDNGFVICHLP